MTMSVLNSASVALTLGNLNKVITESGKKQKTLSTGEKINTAGDSAAEYAISERMQAQIKSLDQDVQNTKTGASMLGVAAGGVESILNELRSMKAMAINAASDHNTDMDRVTIQKEFDQRKADIEDIASSINYNGKRLLDGTYAHYHKYLDEDDDGATGVRGATSVTPLDDGPTGTPTVIASGDYTISAGGVYQLADGYTGTVSISAEAAASGVRFTQQTAAMALNNVTINVSGDNAKLWIENLNITNTEGNVIQFTGENNQLTLLGSSTLTNKGNAAKKAVVNMGKGLTVNGNGSTLTVNNSANGKGAGIGTDAGQRSSGNLIIRNANINTNMFDGAGIGSGGSGGSVGNIEVDNSTIHLNGHYFAGIGAGSNNASCGDILVKNSTIKDIDNTTLHLTNHMGSIDTGIGSGYSGSRAGNITVDSSVVEIRNSDSACIGSGDGGSTCKNITITNTDYTGYSEHGAGIGSGRNGSSAQNIYIKNASKIVHESPEGAAIGSGLSGSVEHIYISKSSLRLLDASKAFQADDHEVPGIGHGEGGTAGDSGGTSSMPDDGESLYRLGTPLIIHTGTKANQNIRCWIEDLRTEALGIRDMKLTTQASAQRLLGDVKDKNSTGPIDAAIEKVLGEATQIGAYMSRLDYTAANLIVSSENVQNSESVIRDANMAKEMTDYTRDNILTQSAQAMLSQANKSAGQVLQLLQ
ncbi:flagellin [Selenomonas sp. GACV-9]|uniref:flagellin N-terminal helical domain-containing protein n=1 Tax=Selenomonas sp. GACV-9 TaxID=3158782 RepID=UPI0008E2B89C|nr:flagellin [Selenomonas ruminantium]